MNMLNQIIQNHNLHFSEDLSDEDYAELQVKGYNSIDGGQSDLYNCPICRNKQMIAFVSPEFHDFTLRKCECVRKRKALVNIRKSGLTEELRRKTFDTYITAEKWQENFRNTALEFLESKNHWFYAGGMSGSGKTHICTAICNKFLNQGRTVKYVLWRELFQKLSANKFSDEYENIIRDITDYDVVYIDDFLKSSKAADELNAAFEVINALYIRRKPLILSSELFLADLNKLDCASAGRIAELSGKFIVQIPKTPDRNFRLRRAAAGISLTDNF